MARGTQHRKRRPPANARVAQTPPAKTKRVKHERWEDQLFFSRLRGHAKWVFVFLAFVFALSFVVFGVGSGSTGITDAMQNLFTRSSGGSSLSSLQKKAKENPKSPAAWRALATKLESDQKLDRATVALERYIKLKPKDEAALQEVARPLHPARVRLLHALQPGALRPGARRAGLGRSGPRRRPRSGRCSRTPRTTRSSPIRTRR